MIRQVVILSAAWETKNEERLFSPLAGPAKLLN